MTGELPKGTVTLTGDALFRAAKAAGTTHRLLLYVGDWISHLGVFSDSQLHDILRFIRSAIEYVDTLPQESDCVRHVLSIADYRWVSVTGIPTIWDSVTAEEQVSYVTQPITYMTCDIMAIRRLAEAQEKVHDVIADQLVGSATPTSRDVGSSRRTPETAPER